MAKRKNVHVVPRSDGWVIRKEGNSRATSVHKTQRDAVEAARELARAQSTELVIHGRDGRIRNRDSYTSDPTPVREPRQVLFPDASASTSDKAIKDAVAAVVHESKSVHRNGSRAESRG